LIFVFQEGSDEKIKAIGDRHQNLSSGYSAGVNGTPPSSSQKAQEAQKKKRNQPDDDHLSLQCLKEEV